MKNLKIRSFIFKTILLLSIPLGVYAASTGIGELYTTYKQTTKPSTPAATYQRLYFKSDGKAYTIGSSGVETAIGGGAPSGAAGGDLSGTYPNPNVSQLRGGAVPLSATVVGTNGTGQLVDSTSSVAPAFGTLTNTKWCTTNGTTVSCTQDTPQTTLVNPITGSSTNHYWSYFTGATTLGGKSITASKPVCSDASGDPAVCAGTEGVWLTPGGSGASLTGLTNSQIPVPTTTVGTSRSVTENAEIVFCTAACNVTPLTPTASGGQQLCVKNAPGTTGAITLVNISGVYYGKTDNSGWQANANYKLVSGGANTDQICIVGYDATHYMIMNSVGTWTHTAP